jgi:hypothetical protein
MYPAVLNRVIAMVVLCSLCLQGCRSNFQVTPEDFTLKKSSNDVQATNQVLVPDVLSSVLADVPHSKLPIVVPATLPSAAHAMVRVASPTYYLAVEPDAVADGKQTSSTEPEEVDKKPAARPIARIARFSSVSCSAPSRALSLQTPSVFGSHEWSRYFGEVGAPPSLPPDIDTILHSDCPFWPERAVKDTHLLVLIPATVDGKAFSLNLLGELIKCPQGGGYATEYGLYGNYVREVLGTRSPGHSYWVLMTRDVLEGSRHKAYAAQKALVAQYASRTGLSYVLPGVLEAAAVVLSHYVRSGERLYKDDPWTYTRCQEWVDNQYPVVVGGFASEGLFVRGNFSGDCDGYGAAGLRKF